MLEILFERLHAPAAFLALTPMIASFAHGRQTSLIVDIGAMGMRVTPIVDGFLLKSAQRRTGRGGEWLAHVQYCALEQYHHRHHHYPTMKNKSTFSLHPRYMTMNTTHNNNNNNNNWTQTYFHQMAQRQVLYEMKTSAHILPLSLYRDEDWTVPFASYSTIIHNSNNTPTTSSSSSSTSPSTGTNNNNNNNNGGPSYSLPDGTSIQLNESSMGYDFCRLPEVFFVPSSLLSSLPPFSSSSSSSTSSVHQQQDDLSSFLSIQELIHNSLSAVLDIDIRKELMNNIILTGSSSMYTHMEQRLSYELSTLFPYTYKNKILSSRDGIERQFAPWIGASILSSLGSFQQLWLSQKEYNEYGALLSLQRFP